jgi:hypothetical protein
MRTYSAVVAFFLCGCATSMQVRGPYAAALSSTDIRDIRRVAQLDPHGGRRTVTLMAEQRDRVRVATRNYSRDSWVGTTIYVVRRGSGWSIDPKASGVGEAEGSFRIY